MSEKEKDITDIYDDFNGPNPFDLARSHIEFEKLDTTCKTTCLVVLLGIGITSLCIANTIASNPSVKEIFNR
jgi:hypothetical protein